MSILDALKKLIIKRGGTAKGSNIAEVISNYANEDSPSPSGGGNNDFFIVHFSDTDDDTISDKSASEIAEAVNDNKIVFGVYYGGEIYKFHILDYGVSYLAANFYNDYVSVLNGVSTLCHKVFKVREANEPIEFSEYYYALTNTQP